MDDLGAMARALELARRGWGRVHPNPLVGAVLLRDGKIVGEGAHLEYGGAHAEIEAIASADDASGTTCVVTLEPCAHHGKTPPCADALIAAAVSRVVYAIDDPGEASGGADRLRAAGVSVDRGPLADESAQLNAPFFFDQTNRDRPWIALKLATSMDGFIADTNGRSQWISGSQAREYVHWLRAGFDAIGVGRGTVEADDPRLTVRGSVRPRQVPRRVVFSARGRLEHDRTLVRTAGEIPTILVTDTAGDAAARADHTDTGVQVVSAETLAARVTALRRAGIRTLLVEGGSALARALLGAELIDRVYWIQAPCILGDGLRAFHVGATSLDLAHRWHVVERRALGDDTLLVVDRSLCSQES